MQKFIPNIQKNWLLRRLSLSKPGEVNLPTAWHELTTNQFKPLASVIYDQMGKRDIIELRLLMLQAITGYERSKKRYTEDEAEQINCNLYILSQFVMFPFRTIYDNPDLINLLSPELQKRLQKCFLFEIHDSEFTEEIAKFGGLLKYKIDLNLNITSNLIPDITIGGIVYKGPRFNIDKNGILDTSLVAGQWIDANDYANLNDLAGIAACLYFNKRADYSTSLAQEQKPLFENANPADLKAIWLVFKAMQNYLVAHPRFSVLFSRKKKTEEYFDPSKIEVSSSDIIYHLVKEGTGSLAEVMNMPVLDFLNIQVKNIADAIKTLREMGKKNGEIAKALKMDIDIVVKF